MLETVKCPYCGADMEEGVIQSSQEIAWLKEKAIVGASWLNEGAVQLAPFPALKGSPGSPRLALPGLPQGYN